MATRDLGADGPRRKYSYRWIHGQRRDYGSPALNSFTSPGASSPIGPWLKDTPYNPGHYAITVTGPAPLAIRTPSVSVIPAGTATNPCANAT